VSRCFADESIYVFIRGEEVFTRTFGYVISLGNAQHSYKKSDLLRRRLQPNSWYGVGLCWTIMRLSGCGS
jgi:hypothetical protein